jgi:uncharacterized protein with FMN-binding domain
MRRAIITIGSTAAGLAALLAFKSHPVADASAATTPAAAPTPTLAAGPSSAAGSTSGYHPGSADGAGKGTSSSHRASASPSSSASSASGGTRTLTGTVANTQYGPMQVQVVLTDNRITKVNVLQQTDDGQMSNQVDAFALPKLTSETLTAQSARIDAVSGASYTSQGYIQSLQSALDQAMA